MNMITEAIEAAEKALGERAKHLQKLEKRLAAARRDLAKNKRPVAILNTLIEELRNMPTDPPGPNWRQLVEVLSQHKDSLSASSHREFLATLRTRAENSTLVFRMSGDQLTIGPFGLSIDAHKGSACLEYAKLEVARNLPLDAQEILTQAKELESTLLAPPTDLGTLAAQLEEAIRVVLARHKRLLVSDELRAELPAVYRELLFMRQGWSNIVSKRKLTEYSLTRFVVEVKTLIQSEQNLSGSRRFRLEPAVIENTRNFNKAIFIPSDLSHGFGEGMYFQAIILFGPR
jgi:hypothetical protein